MNRIRNLFGRVNIFVRGTFNYVLGASSEDEDEKNVQEGLGQTDDAVGQNRAGSSKYTPRVKRKKKGKKKKKKAKRRNTPSRVHPRQKQIIVKIPEGPQPFNTGNLFKVPSKSHTKIDLTSAALAKDSDKLLISEKTVHLEHAIKYGNKAEAIDVREELSKAQQPKKEPGQILPSIVVEQQKIASGAGVLASRADANKPLMEAGIRNFSKELNKALIDRELSATRADIKKSIKESLLNSKRDETMKLFDNEFKLKTQTSKPVDEVKYGLGNILPLSSIKDETEKLKPSSEGFKPKAQETKTTGGAKSGLGNSLPSSSKTDEIKKPSFKEFKPKTQNARKMDEHKPGRQEAKLKLPDIHSCQGSLVSQPISCSVPNQPLAMSLPIDKRPSLLTMVQKNSFLSTLETIQEKVEEKYFNSQSLLQNGVKSSEKVARLVGERSDVCKRDRKAEVSHPRLTGITQAAKFPSQNGLEKIVVKDDINVEAMGGRAALEKTAVKKKSKKQRSKKNKKNSNGDKGLIDGEAVESSKMLNPIAHNGKSPLERLREVESKLLAQKHLQLGKVFSKNNKVAPLSTKELGVSKKKDLRLGTSQECSTGATKAVRPLLKPLKNEISHTEVNVLPTSLPAVKVPEVLPTPSALPRILPRCQSPKIFNKTANEEQAKKYNYYANPSFGSYVNYEPSDEEEELVTSSRMREVTKTKKIDSHSIISPYAYEPSDREEQKDNMEIQPAAPKRNFSVQDRLRMGRKVMSSDKESKESKYQARKDGAGLKVPSTGLPRGKEAQSSTPKEFVFPSTSRYSNPYQLTRNQLPSLHPQSKNATAKKDDLKILELFGLETNEF